MIDDIAVLKELVRNRENLLRDCMKERDALRAEIAAMQEWKELAKQYKTELDAMRQQEPVGEVVTTLDFPYSTVGRLYTNKHLPLGTLLYAAHGAQPDHFEQDLDMVEARRIAREYAWSHTDIDSGNLYWALHVALRKIDSLKLAPYDQTTLELCEICGWRACIPGECCLMCRYQEEAK